MGFVVKRGDKYSARLVIPKALRPILGQNEFKKSLGTSSKTEAGLRAAPLILHWKKLIEDAKTDGITAKAEALRRALDNSPNNDLIDEDGFWELTKAGIIEDAIEEVILSGRDINSIDNKEDKAKVKTLFDIASGQVTTLDDYVNGWLLSIEHLKARTIKQMKRDVTDFLKEERIQLRTRESVAAWIKRNNDISPKSIKRKLGSLGSFWDYLMAQGIVAEMSPFQGHKLPRERKTQQTQRRAFTNDECLKLIGAAKDDEDTVLFDLIMFGLYTGARIEELCQLRVEDVVVEDNCRALRITKSKTVAGTRLVPIHPSINELIDKFVTTSRDDFLIFSKSKNQYDERSTGLSRRFGRLKSSLGYGPELVFHSLRKTVTTKLEQAGVPEGVAADIVGQEKQTITYGLYSGGTAMAQKMEAIAKISY